jgi:hypothetical protein
VHDVLELGMSGHAVSFSDSSGMEGWKARRYRPTTCQNQRFAGVSGMPVVRAACVSGNC